MLMVSRFMNCLGFSHLPRNAFFFWSFLQLFTVFFFLCCEDLVDIFSHILLYLLIKFVVLAVLTYYFIRDVRQPLSQIRLSVSMSLGAGQIIFLAGINATENKVSGLSFISIE